VKRINKNAPQYQADSNCAVPIGAERHTFETIGGESRDQVAVNHIMGHADNSMAGVYRERIQRRLRAVVNNRPPLVAPAADGEKE
jgi:hypothetical protein